MTQRIAIILFILSIIVYLSIGFSFKSTKTYALRFKNLGGVPELINDNADAEWAALEKAESENKEAWDALFKEKLEEWKEMKEKGILEKLSVEDDEMSQELIEEIDHMSKRLLRKKRGRLLTSSSSSLSSPDQVQTAVDDAESIIEKENYRDKFYEKLTAITGKKGTSLASFNLLNEIKDKGVLDTDLIEAVLMALSRQNSTSFASSGYKQYAKWIDEELIKPSNTTFYKKFILSCAANSLCDTAKLVGSQLLQEQKLTAKDLLLSTICIEIQNQNTATISSSLSTSNMYDSDSNSNSKINPLLKRKIKTTTSTSTGTNLISASSSNSESTLSVLPSLLKMLRETIRDHSTSDINVVVRVLGKNRMIKEIFDIFDSMRATGNPPDDESLEFLTNSFVLSVSETATAKTMADLPPPNKNMPEVLFAGRSNVGKSSLVNMICNRKALASTSPVPGHTSQFHFFGVNENRQDVPSFFIVDVPGMGYAETANNTIDSWRSLLERYVTVRDSLSTVFHLIDARHTLTSTDKQMIEMFSRAVRSRKTANRSPITYTIILTKADRATPQELKRSRSDALKVIKQLEKESQEEGGAALPVPVLVTSSLLKTGRDEMWRLLQSALGSAQTMDPIAPVSVVEEEKERVVL